MCLKNIVNSSSTIYPMVHRTKPSSLNPLKRNRKAQSLMSYGHLMDYSMHTYDNAKSSRASACIRNKMKKFPVSSRVHRKEIRLSSAVKIRFSGNLQVRLAVFEQNHHDYLRRNFWPSLLRLSKPLPASVGEMTLFEEKMNGSGSVWPSSFAE